jgi:hypothetical protein
VVALAADGATHISVMQCSQEAAALLLKHMAALVVAAFTVAADLYQYITDNKKWQI